MTTEQATKTMYTLSIILALAGILLLACSQIAHNSTLYEDGSFIIGHMPAAGGCLPYTPCTDPDGPELYFCMGWLDSRWSLTEHAVYIVNVADCSPVY